MLRYLVDPIFQVINTAGKPATGGYIEVYLHGTRDKYYCASDFNGTLHPLKIPLDSLGANIILADDANAYDIYVYNRYGSLLMSRYNVAPVQGGGSEGVDRIGKVHFLKAVYDSQADVRAPYRFWIVDLEKPNANSPYGYDYAMADEVIASLSAGEIFVLSSYGTAPSSDEDVFVMCNSQNQSREGHPALRIWFARMFASNSPEYMYFTTIYTPSRYNSDPPDENAYPEGRMAILNWRGQADVLSEFHFMPYTELAEVATSGDYDDLSNKPTIPAAQVQSDWDEADSTKVDYIKNKPTIPAAQVQSDWDEADSTKVDYIKNKPTIPAAQVQSDWDEADSTKVDYIKNKPTIPAAQVQSDWDEADSTKVDYIKNKPNLALKEDVSNKSQTLDTTSETEYPSSKATADFVNEKLQRGLNTTQRSQLGYSLLGTILITDSDHRGMMGFEVYCCKYCSRPIRMNATFGYLSDSNLKASVSVQSSVSSETGRFKLAWRLADTHTSSAPKIEIWLIDTIDSDPDTRRCGCVVHMISGMEWANGNITTSTLPSGLTDFTPFYT